MISKRNKFIFIVFATLLSFFAITYFKNWGSVVAEKKTDDYVPKVKALMHDSKLAAKECPKIIKVLEQGIAELKNNNHQDKVNMSYKLIADCYYAAQQYKAAAKSYAQLSMSEPQVPRWYSKQAESLLLAGDYGSALPKAHLASQLDTNADTYLLEARILNKLNLHNKAIQRYQDAIKVANYDQLLIAQSELKALLQEVKHSSEMND